MNFARFRSVFVCSFFCVFSHYSCADLQLNGLSVNSELGKELFIAALYTEEPSHDSGKLIGNQVSRRMELKIAADNLSARSLNRMWVEGMVLNNSPSEVEEQKKNIAALTQFFTSRLTSGDTVQIDFNPGKPITVKLNSTLLGTIASEEFFAVLLRAWIGSIPKTTEFRNGLLAENGIDQDLLARYNKLETPENRLASSK